MPVAVATWVALPPFPQRPWAEAFASLSFRSFERIPWQDLGRAVTNTLIMWSSQRPRDR